MYYEIDDKRIIIKTNKVALTTYIENDMYVVTTLRDLRARFKTISMEEHELLFDIKLNNKIKQLIERVEYSINNDLDLYLSLAHLHINKCHYKYTLKVLKQLKEIFGELTKEEKEKLHLPLNDKEWILSNVSSAYRSISDELKHDSDILNSYIDNICLNRFYGIEFLPIEYLNDKEFLVNIKNKFLEKTDKSRYLSGFSFSAKLLKNTLLFETFKEFLLNGQDKLYFEAWRNKNENL